MNDDDEPPYEARKLLRDCPAHLLEPLATLLHDARMGAGCRRLAGELNYTDQDLQMFKTYADRKHTLPGYEMLSAWQHHDDSTVYQLEVALKAIGRLDAVRMLRDVLTGDAFGCEVMLSPRRLYFLLYPSLY